MFSLHGRAELGETHWVYLTVQNPTNSAGTEEDEGLSHSSSPWWLTPLKFQIADQKKTIFQDRSSSIHFWGGGKRKKWRDRRSLERDRDSLLVRERWKELGWNLKAVPCWCRDFVQTSYPGVADFGMFAKANEDWHSSFWNVLLPVPLPILAKVRDPAILQSTFGIFNTIRTYSIQFRFNQVQEHNWADFQDCHVSHNNLVFFSHWFGISD